MNERRWNLRIKSSSPVVVTGEKARCIAKLENISRSGARIDGSTGASAASVGSCLKLVLQLSAQAFHHVTATVVASGPDGVGLEFERVLERGFSTRSF